MPRPAHRHRSLPAATAALLLVTLLLLTPGAASAQIPVTDLAHISLNSFWHYAHYLQFALQIIRQAEQLAAEYRQIANQLQALRKLANPNWREIATLLATLDGIMRTGHALSYALANADAEFRLTYPGWQPWSDPGAYQRETERALDTMRAGLGAASAQGQSLAAGEDTLAAIRRQMDSTQGHQQALEQLTTLGTFAAQEQLLTRQSLAVSANLQAVANAYWLNREAQAQATALVVLNESALAGSRNASPGWTFRPSWWQLN